MLNETCNSCLNFFAKVHILTTSGSGVKKGFQGTLFVASCKQNAIVEDVLNDKVGIEVIIISPFLFHNNCSLLALCLACTLYLAIQVLYIFHDIKFVYFKT